MGIASFQFHRGAQAAHEPGRGGQDCRNKLLGRASKLWDSDYKKHNRDELLEAPELVATCIEMYALQTSTYRARLKDERLIARYDEMKTATSVRDRRHRCGAAPSSLHNVEHRL